MQVKGLDHVNIVTADLDGSAAFYEGLLGLRRAASPGSAMGRRGAWLYDASDHPIIHLVAHDSARHGAGDRGKTTGWLDHVAFTCEDYEGALRRCEAMGIACRTGQVPAFGLRQIFLTDPNHVQLELNFTGA